MSLIWKTIKDTLSVVKFSGKNLSPIDLALADIDPTESPFDLLNGTSIDKSLRHIFRASPCSKCDVPSTDLKVCAKCKMIRYCSKKCQKEDWSNHKDACAQAAQMGITSMNKYLERLYLEPEFTISLQRAILEEIRSLDLEFSTETAIKVQVLVGVEPVDLQDFSNIVNSRDFPGNGEYPMGMPQVLRIIVSPEAPVPIHTDSRYTVMRGCLDMMPGCSTMPIVIIQMVNTKSDTKTGFQHYKFNIGTPFFVGHKICTTSTDTISIPTLSGTGGGLNKPRTADAYLERINMLIRQDHSNRYHLRTKMVSGDVKLFSLAIRGELKYESHAFLYEYCKAWMAKILREDVYDEISETQRMRITARIFGIVPEPGEAIILDI